MMLNTKPGNPGKPEEKFKPLVTTKKHKLFCEEIKDEYIKDDKIVKENYKKYHLFTHAFMQEDIEDISNIIYVLNQAQEKDKIHIYIQSPGGSAAEGIELVQCIQYNFSGRITTENMYQASSMGSLMFMIGDEKRIVHPFSRHMMHNYSTSHSGKASDIRARVEFFDKHLQAFMHELYVKKGVLSEKKFKKLIEGKEYWQNARDMLESGAATHLKINGKILEKDEALKALEDLTLEYN